MYVRDARPEDRERVIGVLTRAFRHDAIVRYLFPNDATYEHRAALFFGHYFDVRLTGGEVCVCDDGRAGAALWNPPGGNRLGAGYVEDHWHRTVVPGVDREEAARYDAFAETIRTLVPAEPYWYLGLLGTDPGTQRRGVARALLTPMFERADEDGIPIFLETGMPGNLAIYERFGFAPFSEAEVPMGPKVWGLLRRGPLV
jgi:GNAT superfamily N-acetyltransferase